MAELVGVFAASHAPLIVRDWHLVPPGDQAPITSAFQELGRRISAARPDVMIVISADHWVNFFIDNMPSVCIGVGEAHDGPPERFLKDFPYQVEGAPEFAAHLVRTAIHQDFDPSVSHRITLDHGFCVPLWRLEVERMPRIVPIIVNVVEPPLPRLGRCLAWGRLLAEAIRSYPEDLRIGILASGGLSHSIGEPTMGEVDEPFDQDTIRLFEAGDEEMLVGFLDRGLPSRGNGTQEVRNWLVAHAAAGARGFELISYVPAYQLYGGFGWASWDLRQ